MTGRRRPWSGLRFSPFTASCSSLAGGPEAALRGRSPEITPVENFYVVSKNFSDPSIAEQGWPLGVGGMVDRPMRLSLSDLRAMTPPKEELTLESITTNV